MSHIAIAGNPGAIREKQDYIFDPQTGWSLQEIWNGTQNAIQGLANSFSLAGLRVSTSHRGPSWTCRVVFGDQNQGQEIPQDHWGFVAEYAQEDIRANPKVLELAATAETLALWIKDIDAALKAGTPLSGTVDPGQQVIYNMKARGIETFETKRICLRRRRIISVRYVAQVAVTAIEKVYTTAALVSATRGFAIPSIIASRLPADPPFTPVDCTWSWKERADESDIILNLNKAEECKDFVFAAWNNYLYNVIT